MIDDELFYESVQSAVLDFERYHCNARYINYHRIPAFDRPVGAVVAHWFPMPKVTGSTPVRDGFLLSSSFCESR